MLHIENNNNNNIYSQKKMDAAVPCWLRPTIALQCGLKLR